MHEDDLVQQDSSGGIDRGTLLRTMALGGGALSIPALLSAAVGAVTAHPAGAAEAVRSPPTPSGSSCSSTTSRRTRSSCPPSTASTMPAPARLHYQWTGSPIDDVGQMVNAMNAAISGKADGDRGGDRRSARVQRADRAALAAGIPVFAYNADAPPKPATSASPISARTCTSPACRWASASSRMVDSGDVAIFIATPGPLNIQPRVDGAIAAIKTVRQADQRQPSRRPAPTRTRSSSIIDAYYLGHKSVKGMFGSAAPADPGRRRGDEAVRPARARCMAAASTCCRRRSS